MKDEEKYLEDEMEKFGERWPYPASFDGYDKDWVDELAEECAKHFYGLGKQTMKEQMLKDTVEADAEVCKLTERVWITPIDEKKFHQDVYDNFKAGDKVRIVVLKEEEE